MDQQDDRLDDERDSPYPAGGAPQQGPGLSDTYDPDNIREPIPDQSKDELMQDEVYKKEAGDFSEPEDKDAKEGKIVGRSGEDEDQGVDEDLNISK